jgi:hypothetical protein
MRTIIVTLRVLTSDDDERTRIQIGELVHSATFLAADKHPEEWNDVYVDVLKTEEQV